MLSILKQCVRKSTKHGDTNQRTERTLLLQLDDFLTNKAVKDLIITYRRRVLGAMTMTLVCVSRSNREVTPFQFSSSGRKLYFLHKKLLELI